MKNKDNVKNEWFSAGGVNWKRVLHEIYAFAPNSYGIGKKGFYDDEHPLAKRLGIKGVELNLSVSFLQEQGLVNSIHAENLTLTLTEKGFNVALENEKAGNAQLIQKAIVLLTAILAVTGAIEFIVKLHDSFSIFNLIVLFLYSIFFVYVILIIRNKKINI